MEEVLWVWASWLKKKKPKTKNCLFGKVRGALGLPMTPRAGFWDAARSGAPHRGAVLWFPCAPADFGDISVGPGASRWHSRMHSPAQRLAAAARNGCLLQLAAARGWGWLLPMGPPAPNLQQLLSRCFPSLCMAPGCRAAGHLLTRAQQEQQRIEVLLFHPLGGGLTPPPSMPSLVPSPETPNCFSAKFPNGSEAWEELEDPLSRAKSQIAQGGGGCEPPRHHPAAEPGCRGG